MRIWTKCNRAIWSCCGAASSKLKYIFEAAPWRTRIWTAIVLIFTSILFAEFFVYYIVLSACTWPMIKLSNEHPVRAMILSDTHILGPMNGYFLDRIRREWEMHRAFQTSLTIFSPDVAFILGDLFDEGDFVDTAYFKEYADRFSRLFETPKNTERICAVGNHDVGFHYRLQPYLVDRFEQRFNNTGIQLYTIRDVHFILLNSMAMEGDKCSFCVKAYEQLTNISNSLKCAENWKNCSIDDTSATIKYSRPILMQHFPTYRASDEECLIHDTPLFEKFRENMEVLSQNSTHLLGDKLNPRVAFSGHSHDFCRIVNRMGITEYTAASFNYRNKFRPSFLLAIFTPTQYAVHLCYLPTEVHIFSYYVVTALIIIVLFIKGYRRNHRKVAATLSYARVD